MITPNLDLMEMAVLICVFFFEKALFLKYRFFITKQLLLEEKCYSILVNISCDGNKFQLQFLCFFLF